MIQKSISDVVIKIDKNMIILSNGQYPQHPQDPQDPQEIIIYYQYWEKFKSLVDNMIKADMELDKKFNS
jgi:hypothetical protein